jgi:hypothetical protein
LHERIVVALVAEEAVDAVGDGFGDAAVVRGEHGRVAWPWLFAPVRSNPPRQSWRLGVWIRGLKPPAILLRPSGAGREAVVWIANRKSQNSR